MVVPNSSQNDIPNPKNGNYVKILPKTNGQRVGGQAPSLGVQKSRNVPNHLGRPIPTHLGAHRANALGNMSPSQDLLQVALL